ncbi:hypothetical protein D3C87_1016020 [compost metagenome]
MFFIRMMNDMKMKKKLAFTFISVAVLPLLLCGLFLIGKLREIVIKDAFNQVSTNVGRVQKRTEELINVPLDISYRLTNDNRMKRASKSDGPYSTVASNLRAPSFTEKGLKNGKDLLCGNCEEQLGGQPEFGTG